MLLQQDHYINYQELTDFLLALADKFPNLVKIQSLGLSPEGRHLWLASLTDYSTGKDSSKPAMWIDGNIHSDEVAGCQAACHLLDFLTSQSSIES